MVVTKDRIVSIHYTLKNSEGNILESTEGKETFTFVYGHGNIVPGLEKAIEGLKAGDEKRVIVSPEEGYGLRNKDLVIKLNRNELPKENISLGQEFRKVFSDGETEVYRVTGFIDDWVYLDRNHPFAGMELHFEVMIIDVKPASAS